MEPTCLSRLDGFNDRRRAQYGEKYDPSALAANFVRYYNSGERIEVRTTYASGETFVRRGRVGVTTGWRPAFILLAKVTSHGSGDVLSPTDEVVRVISR